MQPPADEITPEIKDPAGSHGRWNPPWRRWPRASALAAPALLALVILGPALLAPWNWFVGRDYLDAYGTQWFFWLADRQLAGQEGLGSTAMLFYPWGKDVYLHTGGNLLDAYLSAPLRWLFGATLGYNLWLLAVLLGNAWALGRLARALGARRWAMCAAGLWMVSCPYVLQELQLGRPTQAFLFFPLLCLAALLALRDWRHAVAVGVFMALSAWSYWYYGMLVAACALLHGVWRLAVGPERGRVLVWHAVAALLALALVLPTAWPLLQALQAGEVPGLLVSDAASPLGVHLQTVEGDNQGLFVFALGNGTGGSLLDEEGLRYNAGPHIFTWVHLLLLLAGLVWARRHRGVALLWLVLALGIALGPVMIVGEQYLPNPLYRALMETHAVFRRWWWPGRALFLVHGLTAALGAVALERLSRRWLANSLLVVGLAVVLLSAHGDGLFPMERWARETSPGMRCLAGAAAGAVVDLPYARDQRHLYLQTLHEKPILGGMLSKKSAFAPEEQRQLREENTFLELLIDLGDRRYTRPLSYDAPDRQRLVDLGYRYLLVRTDAYQRPKITADGGIRWLPEWPRLRRNLFRPLGDPAYEDDHLAIYRFDGQPFYCVPTL